MTPREYFSAVMAEIKERDPLHYKQITPPPPSEPSGGKSEFWELCEVICRYCAGTMVSPQKLTGYYLRFIDDYRREALHFFRTGEYSCKNQAEAEEKVYSNKDVMEYQLYALLLSQLLWKHHFDIFLYLKTMLPKLLLNKNPKILDVGAGHGLFSYLVKSWLPDYRSLDIVDISEQSLEMTRRIAGVEKRIQYIKKNIFDFDSNAAYDLIILGEVLEHLDEPGAMLSKLSQLLAKDGILWLTVPANSPAIDHVYLFRSRKEVLDLIEKQGLRVLESAAFCAGGVDEDTAEKKNLTIITAAFCKKL